MRNLPLIKQIIIISITFAILMVAILVTLHDIPMGSATMSSMPMRQCFLHG